jgi:GNAT superfamily N-acetyltransferase
MSNLDNPINSCRLVSVSPYRHSLRDERIVILNRPLVEAEFDMVRAFVRRLERNDLRLRFGNPRDFDDEGTLRRAFDIKARAGEIVWSLDEAAAISGIAHCVRLSQKEAEIGLIVRSDLKRLGIGEYLLREVIVRSAKRGLKILSGWAFRDNRAMLRLAAKIGGVCRLANLQSVEWTYEID